MTAFSLALRRAERRWGAATIIAPSDSDLDELIATGDASRLREAAPEHQLFIADILAKSVALA